MNDYKYIRCDRTYQSLKSRNRPHSERVFILTLSLDVHRHKGLVDTDEGPQTMMCLNTSPPCIRPSVGRVCTRRRVDDGEYVGRGGVCSFGGETSSRVPPSNSQWNLIHLSRTTGLLVDFSKKGYVNSDYIKYKVHVIICRGTVHLQNLKTMAFNISKFQRL